MANTPPVGRKVTLSDIAAGCDVSRATVSLVLRGSPLVNKHTRARVEEELRRQGYVYNRAAANLRRRTSSSIALVLNDLANPFFAEFAAGVDEILGNTGYVTLLGSTSESTQRELAVLGSLIEHGPAGIILSPAEGSDAQQVLAAVGAQTPLLLFNREVSGDISACDHWDRLFLDNQHGARLATEHLIAQGHQRIAFYGGHGSSSSCKQRRAGYAEAMKAAGLSVESQRIVECIPNRLDAVAQCDQLFNGSAAPTAAVCYNDAVALGLMLGLHQRGLQPGRDFALTGFDDIAEAAVSAPPLTTLAVTPRARGRQAAELILQRLQDPSSSPRQTIVPVQLLIRESSCPPA
ncbi:LacI family DNA-binding transcriptional regulator [Dyella caseinilytica]|uniref:LacI family DNA-binding transcriptional regulator n=1 Tax=Dyella caseinilytica TaxID=1849581 RepID=A0ABX7GV36_9GAMM|nr:LacI family DNA-binding transcriptional regulator [Dyella caseinilytica]QRN54322.1 LacI family DNA-binding transcriptional regulator [Dyella caseinilytica]GFZ93272.1 transcriptional regulator [Dyella caseinilytica]